MDSAAVFSTSGSAPACFTQSSTAVKTALLEFVAPDTASTANVCFSTIVLGIRSNAFSQIPAVSLLSFTSTFLISFSENVTSTVTGPLFPVPCAQDTACNEK